ncbi:hypothetical protein Hdeb2414_s0023g00622051 [Helianthus debilis subsp. tardiflorus]
MCVTMDERMKMMACDGEVSSAMRIKQRLWIRAALDNSDSIIRRQGLLR